MTDRPAVCMYSWGGCMYAGGLSRHMCVLPADHEGMCSCDCGAGGDRRPTPSEALDEVARIAQEHGGYDDEHSHIRDARIPTFGADDE